jgi:hypothetical protein
VGKQYPNESEFRSYFILTHYEDRDISRQVQLYPRHVYYSLLVQQALAFLDAYYSSHPVAQGNAARLFKMIGKSDVSVLTASVLEHHFSRIRKEALLRLGKATQRRGQAVAYAVDKIVSMLGFDDATDALGYCKACGLQTEIGVGQTAMVYPDVGILHEATMVENRLKSERLVGSKMVRDLVEYVKLPPKANGGMNGWAKPAMVQPQRQPMIAPARVAPPMQPLPVAPAPVVPKLPVAPVVDPEEQRRKIEQQKHVLSQTARTVTDALIEHVLLSQLKETMQRWRNKKRKEDTMNHLVQTISSSILDTMIVNTIRSTCQQSYQHKTQTVVQAACNTVYMQLLGAVSYIVVTDALAQHIHRRLLLRDVLYRWDVAMQKRRKKRRIEHINKTNTNMVGMEASLFEIGVEQPLDTSQPVPEAVSQEEPAYPVNDGCG